MSIPSAGVNQRAVADGTRPVPDDIAAWIGALVADLDGKDSP